MKEKCYYGKTVTGEYLYHHFQGLLKYFTSHLKDAESRQFSKALEDFYE
jgi:hypothetical protein